ncbi:MAG TPA: hypothetical protein VFS43_30045 [Polyangiaceae bacterium]|nr:hypothetical protein [Polyangiaceae bacterium]
MARLVNALFVDSAAARAGVESLLRYGFDRDHISVAMSDATLNKQESPDGLAHEGDRTAKGAAVGGSLGAVVVGLAAVGAFAAAGPLAALLAGASAGGIGGSLLGALIGSGVGDKEAHAITSQVSEGGIIVAVEVDEAREREVREVLRSAGGKFVSAS